MTLTQRVANLDASLSPTQLVLRWLDEVHAFGDLGAAVEALLAEEDPVPPLDRLAREATDGVRARLRGKPRDVIDEESRRVLRETYFRFELVMRINVIAHERLREETLVYGALSANLALLVSEDRAARRADRTHLPRLVALRGTLLARVDELIALEAAWSSVERRYLSGHPALFPDALEAWAAAVQQTKELAVLAFRLAELDGAEPVDRADADDAERITRAEADLVEPAEATALEKPGEGEQAQWIANRWLRQRIARKTSALAAVEDQV